jgi:hypothetical protein
MRRDYSVRRSIWEHNVLKPTLQKYGVKMWTESRQKPVVSLNYDGNQAEMQTTFLFENIKRYIKINFQCNWVIIISKSINFSPQVIIRGFTNTIRKLTQLISYKISTLNDTTSHHNKIHFTAWCTDNTTVMIILLKFLYSYHTIYEFSCLTLRLSSVLFLNAVLSLTSGDTAEEVCSRNTDLFMCPGLINKLNKSDYKLFDINARILTK